MKQILSSLACGPDIAWATVAAAECYADYKAKQDNPLRLHYGVMQVSACDKGQAQARSRPTPESFGLDLAECDLTVFGPEGLDQRKANAGKFYLRF